MGGLIVCGRIFLEMAGITPTRVPACCCVLFLSWQTRRETATMEKVVIAAAFGEPLTPNHG
jgi:hypothetical protein